ncbi:MAG: hypothetical protein AB1298_10790 [Bacteroidota bacterium]
MNTKKFVLAVVVVFILLEATSYLVHSVILSSTYMQESISKFFSKDMQANMWKMWITDLIWSFFFVFIFTKGYQNKGWMEGVRYGVYIGLFMNLTAAVAQNVVYAIPFYLALQWFIYGFIQSVILGVAVSLIYKPAEQKT